MQQLPLVSVIVAAYNQEKYIGRCLRSLLHQTYPQEKYEIIVINDGSTDRTAYALELFHDGQNKSFQCVRVIQSENNMGLPAALNRGIRASQAPYVVRVDSDDYVNADFLNFMHSFIDQNQYMDAVACDYLMVNDAEQIIERVNCMERPIACGIMFQRQHLLEIGLYDEDFRCHEDRDLRLRYEKKYGISRLEMPLYRYRQHGGNMTKNATEMDRHEQSLVRKHGFDGLGPTN